MENKRKNHIHSEITLKIQFKTKTHFFFIWNEYVWIACDFLCFVKFTKILLSKHITFIKRKTFHPQEMPKMFDDNEKKKNKRNDEEVNPKNNWRRNQRQ